VDSLRSSAKVAPMAQVKPIAAAAAGVAGGKLGTADRVVEAAKNNTVANARPAKTPTASFLFRLTIHVHLLLVGRVNVNSACWAVSFFNGAHFSGFQQKCGTLQIRCL
jgi:hypothetical protein